MDKPRVIGFTLGGALTELRLSSPLYALYRAGEIAGFTLVHGDGQSHGPHELDECDCILVQRDCYPWLSDKLFAASLPYILDLDDLLVARPDYSNFVTAGNTFDLIARAAHITCATQHLRDKLAAYTHAETLGKSSIVPNGMVYPLGCPDTHAEPSAVVWTSADFSSLTRSAGEVIRATDRFARERDLPIYLFGNFKRDFHERLGNAKSFGFMDFWAHKMFLASHPGFVGIAALETTADQVTLDFINSKSDLKMVEYGGFGHAAVYSRALPYIESNLTTGVLTENRYAGWYNALHQAFERAWDPGFINAQAIRENRDIARVARDYWLPAIRAARLSAACPVRDLLATAPARQRTAPAAAQLVPDQPIGRLGARIINRIRKRLT